MALHWYFNPTTENDLQIAAAGAARAAVAAPEIETATIAAAAAAVNARRSITTSSGGYAEGNRTPSASRQELIQFSRKAPSAATSRSFDGGSRTVTRIASGYARTTIPDPRSSSASSRARSSGT